MNDTMISVLIPAYNVERYLPRCLDSVLSQTFKDFEVIVIDDGSTDGTGNICDDYAEKDSRVKVYHQENKGISATRELCLQYASGEYIQFVDSDDWIEFNMLEVLAEKISDCQPDIITFDFSVFYAQKKEIVSLPSKSIDAFRSNCVSGVWTVLWKNLIRKDLYEKNGVCFPVGIDGGEDYLVISLLSICANKIVYVPQALYNYNKTNSLSVMSSMNEKKIRFQIQTTEMLEKQLISRHLAKSYRNELLERKFYVKIYLLRISLLLWLKTFPESTLFFFWSPPRKWIGFAKSMLRMVIKK